MVKISKEAALAYHENNRPGKIEVKPTKPYHTQTIYDFGYAYFLVFSSFVSFFLQSTTAERAGR